MTMNQLTFNDIICNVLCLLIIQTV